MIRGTTQGFKFNIPSKYNISDITNVRILFWQNQHNGNEECPFPLLKQIEHCILNHERNEIHVVLNQQETFAFSDHERASVQMRAILSDGTVFGTPEEQFVVESMKDDLIME